MLSYRLSDLALLYQLFSRVKKGQDELCVAFNEYIKVQCMEYAAFFFVFWYKSCWHEFLRLSLHSFRLSIVTVMIIPDCSERDVTIL